MSDYRRRTHTLLPLDSDALRPPKVSEKTWSKKRLAEGPCPGLINPTVLYPLSMHFVQGVLKTGNDSNYRAVSKHRSRGIIPVHAWLDTTWFLGHPCYFKLRGTLPRRIIKRRLECVADGGPEL